MVSKSRSPLSAALRLKRRPPSQINFSAVSQPAESLSSDGDDNVDDRDGIDDDDDGDDRDDATSAGFSLCKCLLYVCVCTCLVVAYLINSAKKFGQQADGRVTNRTGRFVIAPKCCQTPTERHVCEEH